MRYALAIAAMLATLPSSASAATKIIPKEMQGLWCDVLGVDERNYSTPPKRLTYRRCVGSNGTLHKAGDMDGAIDVGPRGIDADMTDYQCKLLTITSIGRGRFIVQTKCREQASDPWKRTLERWRLFNSRQQVEISGTKVPQERLEIYEAKAK
jgi:hypothetical protein